MEKLVFKLNGGEPTVIALGDAVVTVGRHPSNTVVVDSEYLSCYHARITRLAGSGSFEVQDLESRNTTKVNGVSVSRVVLQNGDALEFGDFVAHFEGPEEPVGGDPQIDDEGDQETLSSELDRARSKLNSVRLELSKVRAELVSAQEVGRAERSEIEKEREQIAEQSREMERKKADQVSDAELRERRDGIRAEIADREVELARATERVAVKNGERDQVLAAVKTERKTLEEIVASVAARRDELASVQGEVEEFGQRVSAGEATLSQCRENRAALEAELDAGRSSLSLIEKKITKQTALLRDHEANEIEQSVQFAAVNKRLEAKILELKALEERRERAAKRAKPVPVDHESAESSDNTEGVTLEAELMKLGFDLRAFPQSEPTRPSE